MATLIMPAFPTSDCPFKPDKNIKTTNKGKFTKKAQPKLELLADILDELGVDDFAEQPLIIAPPVLKLRR